MVSILIEIICSFLTAMSFVFILVQLRAKLDRSFLAFGVANLLLCVFCAIDIWIQPNGNNLFWTRVQHILVSFLPVILILHITLLIKKNLLIWAGVFLFFGILFSVLFLTDLMFVSSELQLRSTALYNAIFSPYVLFVMVFLIYLVASNVHKFTGSEKKALWFHLIGIFVLCTGGLLDLFFLIAGFNFRAVASWSIFGVFGFSLMTTFIFTEKLAVLILDRESTLKKLSQAHRELNEVQLLKDLGQSTAVINHEIRNYAFAISSQAKELRKNITLKENSEKILYKIETIMERLLFFSKEILDFSSSRHLESITALSVSDIVHTCIATHFHDSADKFEIANSVSQEMILHGDQEKLELVFFNIFKNSLEANAQKISVSVITDYRVVVCSIEDDGIGCDCLQMEQLFKAFYSTKKNSGGTGLGLSLVRSILERHGGHISAYANRAVNGSGLTLQLSLPCGTERFETLLAEVVLCTENLNYVHRVLRLFQNIGITPLVVKNSEELKTVGERYTILFSKDSLEKLSERNWTRYLLRESGEHTLVFNSEDPEGTSILSEAFLMKICSGV